MTVLIPASILTGRADAANLAVVVRLDHPQARTRLHRHGL